VKKILSYRANPANIIRALNAETAAIVSVEPGIIMMNFLKTNKVITDLAVRSYIIVLIILGIGYPALGHCGNDFQISGYYLGGSPEELGLLFESNSDLEEKYYETEEKDVQLFFVRVRGRLRAYKIIKEESVDEKNIPVILDNLKKKYGPPNRQQIKTSSVRPRFQTQYVTTVKNRAIWEISESQEFIAEVESKKVVYELIDHNPEEIKASKKRGDFDQGDFGSENWDPDY